FYRYLEAGRILTDHTIDMLESRFAFLARMHFHERMGGMLAEFAGDRLEKELTGVLLVAAAWLPSLLLAPFFAFFFLRDGR
ncbi:hypothetical protein Q8G40_30300, partial [Klebsiella pneumoniae]|uniref:hypothetical protein n=1 Tax=Klebsiella pneumoniae TaxID=573 RepID=UPI003013C122